MSATPSKPMYHSCLLNLLPFQYCNIGKQKIWYKKKYIHTKKFINDSIHHQFFLKQVRLTVIAVKLSHHYTTWPMFLTELTDSF